MKTVEIGIFCYEINFNPQFIFDQKPHLLPFIDFFLFRINLIRYILCFEFQDKI